MAAAAPESLKVVAAAPVGAAEEAAAAAELVTAPAELEAALVIEEAEEEAALEAEETEEEAADEEEVAELDEAADELEVAAEEAAVLLPAAALLRVMPWLRQVWLRKLVAADWSEAEQLDWIQLVAALTNGVELHRHAVSVRAEHPELERLLTRQVKAHAGVWAETKYGTKAKRAVYLRSILLGSEWVID